MKSPDEQGEAHERISRILEIVKAEKMPSAKQKGKKQDKPRKFGTNTEGRVKGADGRRGDEGDEVAGVEETQSPKAAKVWMRKSEVPQAKATAATALNAAAPEFTPSIQNMAFAPSSTQAAASEYGCGAISGYTEYEWTAPAWEMDYEMLSMSTALPDVVPGAREGEFLGLQCIAEMGEWMVFREMKDNAKPFFWNMYTEEKSWDPPAILQELGVAEVLQKWSQDLDAFGIEPSPALRNPRAPRNRRGERTREREQREQRDAPPGF